MNSSCNHLEEFILINLNLPIMTKIFFIFILVLCCFSCSHKLVPSNLNKSSGKIGFTKNKIETIKNLNLTVEQIVNAGGNVKRGKSILNRINDFYLTDFTSIENIDWLSSQKNILINLKGKSNKIVYLVAHYDKVDLNPLSFVSTLLNGVLDPLISWSYSSHGAIDNATGVAILLQLAKSISNENFKYNYRILLVGSEESGLRGSRSHVAKLSDSIFNNILYTINTDVIGVKNKKNCVSTNVSNSKLSSLSFDVAKDLGIELGAGKMPTFACSDYAPFKKTSFIKDFGRSLQFNLVGAFLPQRSYFTKKKETEVINFSSCELVDIGDYIGSALLIPVGSLHGIRDNIKLVDEIKLYEQYQLIYNFIKRIETLNELR
ncbi:MAG: Aminopeptidase YwaD [Formosa sp. Hel1_33_131]|nr:MAG: Aminopeptidase YwaD [Formosa sp. Hel1_33_131]